MSVRVRICKGLTWGRTGFRVSGRVLGGNVSVGRSGVTVRSSLGPLRFWKRVR